MRCIRWSGILRSPPKSSPGGRRQSGVFSPRTQKDPGVESQKHMRPGQTFQTIGIISRPRRSNLAIVVPPLLKWLEAHGIKTLIDEETAHCLPDGSKGETRQRVADASQLLLVLGGDGSMLAAARLAAPRGIPILPVNMASLGFLTSFTLEELRPALDDTLQGRFSLSERVMIRDRKSTRLNSSHGYISYAVFCLKKKNNCTRPSGPRTSLKCRR